LNEKEVLKNPSYTTGWIISYNKVSSSQHRVLSYEYFAEGKLHRRKMAPSVDLSMCLGKNKCKDKKFVVMYSKLHPGKSLIDLYHEVSDTTSRIEIDRFE
jgi:hypothetical protein